MRRNIFIAVAAILLLSFHSCRADKHGDKSQSNLTGVYTGAIPSAGGEGIDVRITLSADETYTLEYRYIGKSDSVFTHIGKFSRNPKGDVIVFEKKGEGDFPAYYKLGENALIQLDLAGNAITGELADNYILKNSNRSFMFTNPRDGKAYKTV